jgi:hypothetical protein
MMSNRISASLGQFPRAPSLRALPQKSQLWFTRPMIALLVLLPLLIVFLVQGEYIPALLVAYANVLVIGWSMIYFVRQRSYSAFIPVLFLTWFLFSWPLASIYFGLIEPERRYATILGYHFFLEDNLRLQLTSLVFLIGYLAPVFLLNPRGISEAPKFSARNPATKKIVYLVTAISLATYSSLTFNRFFGESTSIVTYFFGGAFHYLYALPLLIGVLFPNVPWAVRIVVFSFFGVLSAISILYGGRFYVLVPWVMMLLGLLFFSEWPQRRKVTLLLVAGVLLPVILVVGDTVRSMSKTKNLTSEERQELISNWGRWLGADSILGRVMGRTFSTGGHQLITRTPEHVDFVPFDLAQFGAELVRRTFLPERFTAQGAMYSSTYLLKSYGVRINESTSVELSTPGSLWMMGGWIPLAMGGVFLGLMHSGVVHWIRSATRKSPYQGLFYLAMIAGIVLWGFNLDLISHTRSLVRGIVAAILLWYLVIRPLLGSSAYTTPSVQRSRALPAGGKLLLR